MTFSERLAAVARKGNLRQSDMARWFGRPHPTIRGWLKGLTPRGAPDDIAQIWTLLRVLEQYAIKSKLLPVPLGLSPHDRIRHLKRLKKRAMGEE